MEKITMYLEQMEVVHAPVVRLTFRTRGEEDSNAYLVCHVRLPQARELALYGPYTITVEPPKP